MTIAARSIEVARAGGIVTAREAAAVCDATGMPYSYACAVLAKESMGGQNVYGHDAGGIYSTGAGSVVVQGQTYQRGANIPVTPANAAIFLLQIGAGAKSNGMGPMQITYAADLPDGRSGGYFRQMLEQGLLPWVTEDNMAFGFGLLLANYRRLGSWEKAGAAYNGGTRPGAKALAYGADLEARASAWRKRMGVGR